jgi:hypothetical protein
MDIKPVRIEATLMWPFLDKPNDMSGKYQVDLTNLSEKAVRALEDMGITVRNKEGNGTKAVCVLGAYSWTFKNKKGVSPSLKKLVITDLVTYNSAPKMEEEEEDVL